MVKKLLATLTTDSQGKATYTYTGTGAGNVKFSAESTNNSSLVSKTYSIIDSLFYDKATTDNKNTNWIKSNSPTITTDTNGTSISASAYSTYYANKEGTSTDVFDWTAPLIIEFDIVSYDYLADIQIFDGTHNCNKTFTDMNITGGEHIKIVVGADTVKYFVNDNELSALQYNYTMGTCKVGFRTDPLNGGSIKYKNFRIYSI